ncbi:MAG: AAA family ATPase [Xanthomonadales bacterium]|jgi:general secretion pathway protein A|nr:AAA family ATPase [Xanthomonadales bacterium]
MYLEHFNLSERPFSITPNPLFLYMSQCHREALAHLLYGLGEGGGFVQLTGEVGTGKTSLCRCLLEQVPDNVDLAVVFNPKVTAFELIASVCDELGVEYQEKDASIKKLTDALNQYLLEAHAKGRRTVLIIDEAQNLSADVLEQVRLLTNLETPTEKLLQIILIGQPELRTLLQREDMRQLAQRVTARVRLEPLTREETGAYIEHRLHICGASRPIFNTSAVDRIYRLSGGIPRLINVLCDRALLGAYTEGKLQIDRKIIRQAANEVLADELQPSGPGFSPRWAVVGPVVLLLVSAALYIWWQRPEFDNLLDQATAQPPPETPASDLSADEPLPQVAVAPPSSASPESTAQSPPDTHSGSLETVLLTANESWSLAAWTQLFARWSVNLPAAVAPEYCVFANDLGLYCLAEKGSWGLLRQYNRPAIMELVTSDGRSVPVVLQQLEDRAAQLLIGNESFRLDIGDVDRFWLGEFTLLLRLPPNGHYLLTAGDRNPDVVWLRQMLEAAQQVKLPSDDPQFFDFPLQRQVMDFQRRHGLTPDGVVGKQTLIQLNTYSDGSVPLLSAESS